MIEFRTIEISDPALMEPGVSFVTVKSTALQRRADLSIFVPTDVAVEKLPLVILLHGVYGSHWAWMFKGGAHRVLTRLMKEEGLPPMMLAMPSDGLWGDGSGYLRHRDADYTKWITEEVPVAAALVDARVKDAPRFIAGLSMGGYGAMRLGALQADQFRAISAHSSITDFSQLAQFVEEPLTKYDLTEEHPLSVIECFKQNAHRLPPLRFDCGTSDLLIEPNRELHRLLEGAGIAHVYEEFTGGHEWPYWSKHLADTLRFFAKHG